MPLSFKPQSWKAEDRFVIATITKIDAEEVVFSWEIFLKADECVVTSGNSKSLADARHRCSSSAVTIGDAES